MFFVKMIDYCCDKSLRYHSCSCDLLMHTIYKVYEVNGRQFLIANNSSRFVWVDPCKFQLSTPLEGSMK